MVLHYGCFFDKTPIYTLYNFFSPVYAYSKGPWGLSVYLHNFASSQKIQFRRDNTWDSEGVVKSFMKVGNYPTKNFATLGPSWLQPPFAIGYN